MLFNSLHFLVFFSIVLAAYYSVAHRFRWMLLLLASCYFYMVFIPKYILILFALILIDYTAGLLIEGSAGTRRRTMLVVSLVANIGMLAFYKYFNFLNDNLTALLSMLHLANPATDLNILLPIGLSFHTFQSMSYTIEVYRGNQRAERHLGFYAVYVLFFPQLVAGPIERPQNLLHQFRQEAFFDYARVTDGLKLMLWGFFKKVVIADRLTVLVDRVYSAPGAHNGSELALATYFFAFQIYCDFSGYSDIAIGAAQTLGIGLMNNFNRPYFSKNVSEFWKRWHISLSTWFKDYLYIPLGGNRTGRARWCFNLFVTFLVSGLWHGANWTYLLWGAIHGSYLIFAIATRDFRERIARWTRLESHPELRKLFQVFVTFHLVAFAWIAFRARSISDAVLVVRRIFDFAAWRAPADLGLGRGEIVLALASIAFMEAVHLLERRRNIRHMLKDKPAAVRGLVYAGMILSILFFGKFTSHSFIYFQF
ncbi:MAG: MBOAT family protein [Elusimicrobia bacterium]|nr:MBOAT family protein [Elusimicrobiota bacterium]